ncbi:hypothetical protein [Sulfurimonas sp.]|uniref:hypothetical protein n=1 Tax=Sulfurimonas sp. TaxID=2022749 RepID=UPI002630A163|nr:hypothetical protein [Sulfurimonas sp.]MDD3450470.1 hypothetical protein [Sulfurimonas sp.]
MKIPATLHKLNITLDAELLKEIETSQSQDELIEKLLTIVANRPKLHSKEDVMRLTSIPKQRFEHLVRENKIPHIYINNKIRLFDIDEVYEYLNKNCKVGVA